MRSLMKYEVKKQRLAYLLMLGLLVVLEAMFVVGILVSEDDWIAMGLVLGIILFLVTFVVIEMSLLVTYYHDMRDKQGYMLFMTPKSIHEILGSKLLAGILTIVLVVLVYAGLFFLNLRLLSESDGTFAREIKEMMNIGYLIFRFDMDWMIVIENVLNILFDWIGTMTLGFFVVTLSVTLFARLKASGIISLGLFVVLREVVGTLQSYISEWLGFGNAWQVVYEDYGLSFNYVGSMWSSIALNMLCAIIFYVIAAYLLKKKLAL